MNWNQLSSELSLIYFFDTHSKVRIVHLLILLAFHCYLCLLATLFFWISPCFVICERFLRCNSNSATNYSPTATSYMQKFSLFFFKLKTTLTTITKTIATFAKALTKITIVFPLKSSKKESTLNLRTTSSTQSNVIKSTQKVTFSQNWAGRIEITSFQVKPSFEKLVLCYRKKRITRGKCGVNWNSGKHISLNTTINYLIINSKTNNNHTIDIKLSFFSFNDIIGNIQNQIRSLSLKHKFLFCFFLRFFGWLWTFIWLPQINAMAK